MILAIDTSLPSLSVALVASERMLGCVALEGKDSRNEKLLPAVDWLLRESGVERRALELVAATRGPGSFTGVRIGLATAQGLAVALRILLCAISTHEAIAASLPARRVLVHGEAGRGERYVTGFEEGNELLAPSLLRESAIESKGREFDLVIDTAEVIRTQNVALLAAYRAAAIAARGTLAQYADSTPLYVRLSAAEEKLQAPTP